MHVIQQEKLREKKSKKMLVQTPRQDKEGPELERLVNQARLTTTAQFYDKDKKAGLTEIGPTLSPMKIGPTGLPAGEVRPKTRKRE